MRPSLSVQAFTGELVHFFFPTYCVACERSMPANGELLCVHCRATLPLLDHHQWKENAFTVRFWGRVPIRAGAAMFAFTKASRVQHLLHQLKYEGKKEIGHALGVYFGQALKHSPHFNGVELIVPVPLHERKLWMRGYNQSACFASGLSSALGVPAINDAMTRLIFTESQTRKSRLERLENVQRVFAVKDPTLLRGRHILLVDDVLTTGSTLEACAETLLEQVSGCTISMATIAMALHY